MPERMHETRGGTEGSTLTDAILPVRLGTALLCCVIAVLVTGYSVMPSWGFTDDDAFISFRYVRNLQDGHGLVYNHGERVEAYTDFLWILIVALTDALVGHHLLVAKSLGVFFSAASVAVVLMITVSIPVTAFRRIGLGITVLVMLMVHTPFWIWTTGGLETSLYAFLLLLTTILLVIGATPAGSALWALSGLALALTRPEGLALSFAGLITAGLVEKRPRFVSLLKWAVLAGGLYCAYRAASFSYFGHLLPTSYLVRVSGGPSSDYLFRRLIVGFRYVGRYFQHYMMFLPMLIIAARMVFRRGLANQSMNSSTRALSYIASSVLVSIVMVIYFGGDPKIYSRFMAPLLPLVTIGFVISISDFYRSLPRTRAVDRLLVLIIGAFLVNALPFGPRQVDRWSWNEFAKEHRLLLERTAAGLWVRHHTPKEAVIVAPAAGATPFFAERMSYDGCLVEYSTAARPFTIPAEQYTSAGMTAHAKSYTEETISARKPCVVVGGKRTTDYAGILPFPGFWIPFAIRNDCAVTPMTVEERTRYIDQALDYLMYPQYWRAKLKADLGLQ